MPLTLLGLMVGGVPQGGAADAPLEILIFERPPYYERGGPDGFHGLVVDRAVQALKRAEIPFAWVDLQPNGHLRVIQEATHAVCALGWFKKPEREAFGRFSAPIYVDQPQVILARVDNAGVARHDTAASLFADPSLRLGMKLGYALGPTLDALIEENNTPRSTVSQEDSGLVRMLVGRRFDYMVSAYEEADLLIGSMGEAGKDLVAYTLSDLPQGNSRHLICSQATDPAVIDRFDAALAALSSEHK